MTKTQTKRKRITVTEAAKALGINKSKFYRMLKSGEFPANYTNARGWYITKRAIKEFLDSKREPSLNEYLKGSQGPTIAELREIITDKVTIPQKENKVDAAFCVLKVTYGDQIGYVSDQLLDEDKGYMQDLTKDGYALSYDIVDATIYIKSEIDALLDTNGNIDTDKGDTTLSKFLDALVVICEEDEALLNLALELSIIDLHPVTRDTWIYEPLSLTQKAKQKLTPEELSALVADIKNGNI